MSKFKNFFFSILPKVLVTTGLLIFILSYYQFAWAEIRYYYSYFTGTNYQLEVSRNVPVEKQGFENVIKEGTVKIKPINTKFGLVIEKINLNAPIIKDVPVIEEKTYLEALKQGIAHASFSGYPNQENANVYLFAHSSNNFWTLGKYSSVFNQIHKLDLKDRINLFYEGKRYVYEVENKILINDFKVDETIYESFGPTLTLQTCYPAGTTLNRLVIRASLVGVFDYDK
jgi:LPXTG-site transpeptidase (sortase) family protein